MKFKDLGKAILTPNNYRVGFQEAQKEYEHYLEIQKRLSLIRAHQQLKRGELFLDAIQLNNPQDQGDSLY